MALIVPVTENQVRVRVVLWRNILACIPGFDSVNDAHLGSLRKTAAYNIPIVLTNSKNKAYPTHITAKSVIGIDVLRKAAIGRNVLSNAAFLLSQCAHKFMGGLGRGRKATGSLSRHVNLFSSAHPIDVGSGLKNRTKASTYHE